MGKGMRLTALERHVTDLAMKSEAVSEMLNEWPIMMEHMKDLDALRGHLNGMDVEVRKLKNQLQELHNAEYEIHAMLELFLSERGETLRNLLIKRNTPPPGTVMQETLTNTQTEGGTNGIQT